MLKLNRLLYIYIIERKVPYDALLAIENGVPYDALLAIENGVPYDALLAIENGVVRLTKLWTENYLNNFQDRHTTLTFIYI